MVSKKVSGLALSLILVLSFCAVWFVTEPSQSNVAAEKSALILNVSPEGDSFHLGVDESKTFTACAVNGDGGYGFTWVIEPAGSFKLRINDVVTQLYDGRVVESVGSTLKLSFPQACENEYVMVYCRVVDGDGQIACSRIFVVTDPYTSPGLKFDASPSSSSIIVRPDGKGWFRAINGTTMAALKTMDSTNASFTVNNALGNATGKTVSLAAGSYSGASLIVPANTNLVADAGVTGIKYYSIGNGARIDEPTFNAAFGGYSSGSYTVLTNQTGSATAATWYLAVKPDNSLYFVSTNQTYTIDSALTGCSAGGAVHVVSGNYGSTTVSVPNGVMLTLAKGASGITYSAAASATCAIVDWQVGNIDYYYEGAKTAYINFASNNASFSPAVVWDEDWNATVEDVVDAYSSMAWKSGWNATVEDIVETLFTTQSWNSNWDANINGLIASASLSWSQITNANTTVQQIVDAYSSMAWKSGWNATVSEIASSGVAELTSLIISGTGTFGNVTLSSGYFPTDVDYIVYQLDGTCYAKYSDGSIDFSSENASYVIQSALNALENTYTLSTETTLAQDTGIVFIQQGNYTIDSPITVDKRSCLMGSYGGQTWFVASTNLSPGMLIVNASNLRFQDWGIVNIAIDMVSYDGDGIYSENAGSSGARCQGNIENVIIYNVASGYTGIELTNVFHTQISKIRVYSAGTCVKFLQSGSVIYGNSVFEDWMLWALGNNAVGLNITNGDNYSAINLCQIDRVQIQGTASNSGTYGIWWDGNSLTASVLFNTLNIERMETSVYLDAVRYVSFVEPYIWTDEDNADNYGVRIVGAARAIKCFGGRISVGVNAGSAAWSDESTSTSFKHLVEGTFMETTWGDFESNTRLENVNCYRIGAGVTRQNQYDGSSANNTGTTKITFDHGCFYNPNVLQCSFSTGVITGYTWTTTVSTVTLTVFTNDALPASWTVYFHAEYDPTFNDPS